MMLPPTIWMPLALLPSPQGLAVDWLHAQGARFEQPFMTQSLHQLLAHPFRQTFRPVTGATQLLERTPALPLAGIIAHGSRCGSTLVTQSLKAYPGALVLAEPPILGRLLHFGTAWGLSFTDQVRLLQAVVAGLAQPWTGSETSLVIKLHAASALAWPVWRAAFPATPWLFLFREPAEVLASQRRERGAEMMPGALPPTLFVPDAAAYSDLDAFALALLDALYAAAGAALASGSGYALDYSRLLAAIPTQIAPLFGLAPGPDTAAALATRASRDSKRPTQAFEPLAAAADLTPANQDRLDALRTGPLQALRAAPEPQYYEEP